MTPTDDEDNAPEGAKTPPPSVEEERLLRAVAQLPTEKKLRLLKRLLRSELIPRQRDGEEQE